MGFTNVELLEIFQHQPQNPHFWWVDQTQHPQLQHHPRNDLIGIAKKLNNLVWVSEASDPIDVTPKFNRSR